MGIKKLNEYTQFVANICVILGVFIVVIEFYDFKNSKKSLHQNAITSCMTRFTELRPKLKNINSFDNDTSIIIQQYLDLSEEELFYIQHDIVPEEVAVDWVSGIIRFLKSKDYEKNMNKYYSSYHRINNGFGVIGDGFTQEETLNFINRIKKYKK